MVFLVPTPQGLRSLLDEVGDTAIPIWCSADALSNAEFDRLEHGNVTRFAYALSPADPEAFEDALSTIEEHHPGHQVWVEGALFRH